MGKKNANPQGGKQRRDGWEKPISHGEEDYSAAAAAAVQQQKHKPDPAAIQDRRVDLPAVSERRIAATATAATAAVYFSDESGGDPSIDHKAEAYIASFRNKLKNKND
ncbi:unnamed protein product [Cuscuta campestris]|uniref:Uncharacterized protein n=1 Tax=Cuscuta campestris TaxID=132261 RepID=A0A484MDS4_9ASTE|nr:unnamed protein product [Cuscuta campestris]VFQ87071.1 unnamed protein product [Cuscuta campestris]